jgi:hypothetical protein
MKELYDYINEVRISKEEIEQSIVLSEKDINSKPHNPLGTRNFFYELFNPVKNNRGKNRYSLSNLEDQKNLYKLVCNVVINIEANVQGRKKTVKANIKEELKNHYGVTDGYSFACFLLKNVNFFITNPNVVKTIKTFDLDRIGREYEIYSNNEDIEKFQPGELFNVKYFDPKQDTPDNRTIVLYDCSDPKNKEKTYCFKIHGKQTEEYVEHFINMHKMTYQKITKIPYFDVRPILAVNYIKKSAKFLEEEYFLKPVQGVLKEIN